MAGTINDIDKSVGLCATTTRAIAEATGTDVIAKAIHTRMPKDVQETYNKVGSKDEFWDAGAVG